MHNLKGPYAICEALNTNNTQWEKGLMPYVRH